MNKPPIAERLTKAEPVLSAEFYPPKSEAAAASLLQAADDLRSIPLDFVSITYGAGGSTRNRTLKYARQLSADYGYEVMPHLTCVGHSKDELREIIAEFKKAGLNKIMALRGDPPKGEENFKPHPDGLSHANELVGLIQESYPVELQAQELKPASSPSINIESEDPAKPISYSAVFEVFPEVKPKLSRWTNYEKTEITLDDSDIEA